MTTNTPLTEPGASDAPASFEPIVFIGDDGVPRRFYGKAVGYQSIGTLEWSAYVTRGTNIAVLSGFETTLSVFESFDEFAADFKDMPVLVSQVAAALDLDWVHDLDI